MGQFMFFAILLGCLAVAFAISALWQKSRGLAIVLAIALPVAAFALYHYKGTPVALNPAVRTAPKTLPEAITQLEALTRADPKNFGDQATLARAYMAAEKWPQARDAYKRALALQDDVDLSVEYAESLLRTSPDRSFPPEAVRILQNALQKNPQNQRALFFYGLHQRQIGQPAQAVETWERLLALLDPSTAIALRHQIGDARRDAGLPPIGPASPTVEVTVALDPTLARDARAATALYVFAHSTEGGPPVAVKRVAPGQFPMHVVLGDEDSPMPTQVLSQQKQVLVEARLSMTGDAKQASGDLEADPSTVAVGPGAKVELMLSRSVP